MDATELKMEFVRRRLEELGRNLAGNGGDETGVIAQTLAEFSHILDDFSATLEVVRLQNEDLIATTADLEEQRRWYAEAFNLAPDGYLVTDLNGSLKEMNETARRMFNAQWGAASLGPLVAYVGAAHRQTVLTVLSDFRNGACLRCDDLRIEFTPRERPSFPASVTVGALCDGDGAAIGMRWIVHDISERLRTEEQLRLYREHLEEIVRQRTEELRKTVDELERSNKELEHFSYVASHDLREPLRTVISFMDLLDRRYRDRLDKDAQEFIEFAVDACRRMDNMLHGLLEYSRVGSRGGKFDRIDSAEALKGAMDNLWRAIHDVEAEIKVETPLPTVVADGPQLTRLFQNLLTNSIRFRKPDKKCKIWIRASETNREYIFEVRDNGIGIEPKYQERIFLMFQRLAAPSKLSGAGIGLTVCRKIAERHGGRIWVESELDKGASFFFSIAK